MTRSVSRTNLWVQAVFRCFGLILGNIFLQTSWLHSNNRGHREDSSCIDTLAHHAYKIAHHAVSAVAQGRCGHFPWTPIPRHLPARNDRWAL